MNYMICSKCGGRLAIGVAIKSNLEEYARYLIQPSPINNESLELIPVYKCRECGHSFDNREYNV